MDIGGTSVNLISLKLSVNPSQAGDIYQEPVIGSSLVPTAQELSATPLREHDTYFGWGEDVATNEQSKPTIQEGTNTGDSISSLVWFKTGTTLPVHDFFISQVVLKNTTTGTWSFEINSDGGISDIISSVMTGTISNGEMFLDTPISYSFNGSVVQ